MARKKSSDEAQDPNKLVRQSAGTYRTADERFEVRGEGNRWFLVDTERTDELGQELIRGPLPTLDAVKQAIPEARRDDLRPLPTPKRRSAESGARSKAKARPPPKPPPSWIDRLPSAEAAEVRALIRALEREGIARAEQLVRRDREGLEPAVATALVEQRLAALVDDYPAAGRDAIRELVDRVAAVLSGSHGARPPAPLPGWSLIELGPEGDPPNRRIRLAE